MSMRAVARVAGAAVAIVGLGLSSAQAASAPTRDVRSVNLPAFGSGREYTRQEITFTSRVRPGVTYRYVVARPVEEAGEPLPLAVSIYPLPEGTIESLGWIGVTLIPEEVPDFGNFLGNAAHLLFIEAILDARERFAVDRSRVFVGGCSKGAVAGVALAFAFPDLFAGTWGDSGAYDGGARGSVGMAARQAPAQPAFLTNATYILDVAGATPVEAPWNYDALSAHQLIGDAVDSGLDRHTLAYPSGAGQSQPEDAGRPWNGSGMPIALASGGLDPTSPPAITTEPFAAWAASHSYPVKHLSYPDGGHCPLYRDPAGAIELLRWLHDHPRPRLTEAAYQSADVVNAPMETWPRYDLTGAHERYSLPMQGARRDRGDGLVLAAPHRTRVRLAFHGEAGESWDGRVTISNGAIVRASSIDDGVGLAGALRDVPGSTPTQPAPRREWLEAAAGDVLTGTEWITHTGPDDAWDMVTLEVEAGPTALLTISSKALTEEPLTVSLEQIRAARSGDLVRTLDVPTRRGLLRLQILQSHDQWWSQMRAAIDEADNRLALSARNLAGGAVELIRLGLSTDRELTVTVNGLDHTGSFELQLLGAFHKFRGDVVVNGAVVEPATVRRNAWSLTPPPLDLSNGQVTITVRP